MAKKGTIFVGSTFNEEEASFVAGTIIVYNQLKKLLNFSLGSRILIQRATMKVKELSFGSINIDGRDYSKDLVIHKGKIKKRKKKESKEFRSQFGHTPLSILENIPWDCKKLIIGTGHNCALPVMKEVQKKAKRKGVELVLMSTPDAILNINEKDTNLILHLTC